MRAQRRRSTSLRLSSHDDLACKTPRQARSLPPQLASIIADGLGGGGAMAIGERLDGLTREAGIRDMPLHDVIRAVMAWAAQQSYAVGGYPHARLMMLDTLETILLLDANKKTAKKTAA